MSIELQNISKTQQRYNTLDNLNLTIEDGTFLALVAPTGTGKTTLMRIMAGIDKPDAGRILVDGEDVTGTHVRERNVAMVYQQFINYPSLKVYENIASPLRVSKQKYSRKEIDERVRTVAEQLQIEEFRLELKSLAQERNAIFIYATPEPLDAWIMASHVAVLHGGQIVQYGPMWDVYKRPNHIKAGEYFSDPPMNFFPCQVDDGQAVVAPELQIPLASMGADIPSGKYVLGVRPHRLYVGEVPSTVIDPISLSARVDLAEIVGSDTTLHLSHNDLNFIALVQDFLQFDLDAEVMVHMDPKQFYIFDGQSGALVQTILNDGRDEK